MNENNQMKGHTNRTYFKAAVFSLVPKLVCCTLFFFFFYSICAFALLRAGKTREFEQEASRFHKLQDKEGHFTLGCLVASLHAWCQVAV